MESKVLNPQLAEAIQLASAAFDAMDEVGVRPVDGRDAVECIREIEQLRRRADAHAVGLLAEIDRRGLHRDDGHHSAKMMVQHVARLSKAEATARAKTARMGLALPDADKGYRAGELPTCHARLLGRIHSNPRVSARMAGREAKFLEQARYDYGYFEKKAKEWERLTDEDGPEPQAPVSHDRRSAWLLQDFDLSWRLDGRFGSSQGTAMHEIHGHYMDAELMADWEKARAEHGAAACESDLPRTFQQRAADAMWQIFSDAANNPNGAVPLDWVHNVVWSAEAFEEMVRRLLGGEPSPFNPDAYQCETIDGIQMDPHEAIVNAALYRVRRVIVDAGGTVIDIGEARCFTGSARHAVKLASSNCVWPGCGVPTSKCEADHMVEHSKGGRTYPGNGAPLCGKHNRWKQKGFIVWRDPTGQWFTARPDGTKLE